MSLKPETRAAIRAYLDKEGGTYDHALAMVMAVRKADAWNAAYPVGTPVMLVTYKGAIPIATKTRSIAWAMSSGQASVQVHGRTGSYGLEWVTPCDPVVVRS